MTDHQFLDQYRFRLIQYSKEHQTDFSMGCPMHYIARLDAGKGVIRTDRETLCLEPGTYFYIPKGLPYRSCWYPPPGGPLKLYSFGCGMLPLPENTQYRLSAFSCDSQEEELFHQLTTDPQVSCRTIGILLTLFSSISETLPPAIPADRNAMLQKALAYMNSHNRFSVNDVAEHCGISQSGLYALFQKQLGTTPVHTKNQILAAKAVDLLTSTDIPIEEISSSLDFGSAAYFRRVLREETGLSPSQIRRQARF